MEAVVLEGGVLGLVVVVQRVALMAASGRVVVGVCIVEVPMVAHSWLTCHRQPIRCPEPKY